MLSGFDLRELATTCALSAGVIANDSGPMHLAAAVGAATLGIFGDSDPQKYRALGENVRTLGRLGEWPDFEAVRAWVSEKAESLGIPADGRLYLSSERDPASGGAFWFPARSRSPRTGSSHRSPNQGNWNQRVS